MLYSFDLYSIYGRSFLSLRLDPLDKQKADPYTVTRLSDAADLCGKPASGERNNRAPASTDDDSREPEYATVQS